MAGVEWKSKETRFLLTDQGEDRKHSINGPKRNNQYMNTVDRAFSMICFVLLFFLSYSLHGLTFQALDEMIP